MVVKNGNFYKENQLLLDHPLEVLHFYVQTH
jgi:hypothetical protein